MARKIQNITPLLAEGFNLPTSWAIWIQSIMNVLEGASTVIPREDRYTSNVVKALTKADSGDPTYGENGLLCINLADSTLKIYIDGAWLTLLSW